MATVGTGKYTYTLIQDWAKLPPGETFAMVARSPPTHRIGFTPSSARTRLSSSLTGMETS